VRGDEQKEQERQQQLCRQQQVGWRAETNRRRRLESACTEGMRKLTAGSVTRIALTKRDEAIVRAAWSLGHVTADGLRQLLSPTTSLSTFTARLRRLRASRYLTRLEVVAGLRHTYLYGAGIRARAPGSPAPWRPSLTQLPHTLAVERTLLRLVDPSFAHRLTVTTWQGEAEIRAWAEPGAPFPDLVVNWSAAVADQPAHGMWTVEVDLATEAKAAWKRKLSRYLFHEPRCGRLLVVTTSRQRAANLARLAAHHGAPALTTTFTDLANSPNPVVLDATVRRPRPLVDASIACVDNRPTRDTRISAPSDGWP
jgi:Replication-relaxation